MFSVTVTVSEREIARPVFFLLDEGSVCVHDRQTDTPPLYTVRRSLDENGSCLVEVTEGKAHEDSEWKPVQLWQLSRHALEPLIFQ